MKLGKFVTMVILSATMLWGGVEPSLAGQAVVTASNVQLRAGPGSSYRVVGRLRARERVNVTRCASAGRWCRVQPRTRQSGWVRSRYLDPVRRGSFNRPGSICFHGARGHVCVTR